MEITINQMQEKFKSLPEETRWAIMAANVDDKIIDIGQKNNLTVKQMSQLALETQAVMLGFLPPEEFESSIKISLGLSPELNKMVVESVNKDILSEIRHKLMGVYKDDKNGITHEEDVILRDAGLQIENEKAPTVLPKQNEDISIKAGTEVLEKSDIKIENEQKIEERDVVSESESEMQRDISDVSLIKKIPTIANIKNAQPMQNIIEQKMKGDFKIPSTTTSYNIDSKDKKSVVPEVIVKVKDPYRMSPDE